MKVEIVDVTPALAAGYLKFNGANRPIRRTVVEGLKSAMMRGEYVPSHQGIAFSENGRLLDGQHRLTAISELPSGSFRMLVTKGVSDDAFKVMDIGLKRSAADSLKEDRRLIEVARFLATICMSNRASITPTVLQPLVSAIKPIHENLMAFAPRIVRTWSSAPIRTAAVASIFGGTDEDYVKLSYQALANNEFSEMTPVAQSLVRAVLAGTVTATNGRDLFVRAMTVFDPKKANISKILVSKGDQTPALVRNLFRHLFV